MSTGLAGRQPVAETIPANISKVAGIHNVYLEFASGAGGNPPYVSLHYLSFPVA